MSLNIGELLKKKRLERGLTLEQAGRMIGVSKVTYRDYELNNIKNVRADKIRVISDFLDVTPDELFQTNVSNIKEFQQITQEDFEREIYSLLSKHANVKFEYSAWLFLSKKLLNNVVDLDENQKKQIASYLELFKK